MNLKRTQLQILHEKTDLSQRAKTGVSLHCHTEHSREMMDFIPVYAEKIPIVSYFWKKERDKYIRRYGKAIDFSSAFWSPPLPSEEVYSIEKNQINEAGLEAVVSLTDHDCIDGNLRVNEKVENKTAPVSFEWTVPFEYGFFHVGVHNLPRESAVEISKTLIDFSFSEKPEKSRLHELFSMLNSLPDVLVILNHPLWDIEMVGKPRHNILLERFLKEYSKWIHALEINGFRKWSENIAVLEMAEALDIPVVTGGDRHGCKPNTVINLTNSKTFAEFVEEVRIGKRSEIVFMPEYKYPLKSRQLNSFAEILSTYNHFPANRRRWFDRVHFDIGDGHGLRPLSVHWDKAGPVWLRISNKVLGIMGSPFMRPLFSLARHKRDRVPKYFGQTIDSSLNREEIASNNLSSDAV